MVFRLQKKILTCLIGIGVRPHHSLDYCTSEVAIEKHLFHTPGCDMELFMVLD